MTSNNLKTITQEELKSILDCHSKYLNNEPDGKRADLSYADLRGADLRYSNLTSANLTSANLRYADLRYADLRYANLINANLINANLSHTNLRYANLSYADLRYSDLRYADLDFSLFPLWCGSFNIKCDMRLFAQLAYHMCRLDVTNCEDSEELKHYQEALKPIANKFHLNVAGDPVLVF